jgi:methylmalonyl-CoA/ethylmalonyl-CoA epimerase
MNKPFKILGINHIGIAPKDVAKSKDFFSKILGLQCFGEEQVLDQKTNTIMFASQTDSAPSADSTSRLELLAPLTDVGPIADFLAKKGGGIHHLALTVDNIDAALAYLKNLGVQLVDETPRSGAHNTRIAFIHPRATGGLLLELVQELKPS